MLQLKMTGFSTQSREKIRSYFDKYLSSRKVFKNILKDNNFVNKNIL